MITRLGALDKIILNYIKMKRNVHTVGVDFINIFARKIRRFSWRIAYWFGEFWSFILTFHYVREINWRIFRRSPYANVFFLGKKVW